MRRLVNKYKASGRSRGGDNSEKSQMERIHRVRVIYHRDAKKGTSEEESSSVASKMGIGEDGMEI